MTIGLFLSTMSSVSAEVKSPYVVDEKTQVLFGDSAFISATSTYQGLENYTVNYVNHYLRITFTYTHERRSFASYPPFLYITASDPRATSTPTVRFSPNALFLLGPIPIPPGHETDWYSYDVQFDSTGYTVVVKEAGETEISNLHTDIEGITTSDWAALANRYTLATPPTAYSMSFTPVPIYSAPEPETPPAATTTVATITPVIIVPGIMGSRLLNSDNSEIWPNISLMIFPGLDDFLNILMLTTDGQLIENILPDSITKNIGNYDLFASLFSSLESVGYINETSLFEYPYDWRLDIENSSLNLKNKIDQIKSELGVEKVQIVAHSMGGLLVKKYLKDYGGGSVENFIDIGTPHLGSPKTFKVLNYGDNFGFEKFGFDILNPIRTKEISQNMPSVYQLLPSRSYFDDSDNSYKYYVFDAVSGNDRLSYDQTSSYLKSAGRNSTLVDRADAFHQEIDNLNPADYGVETYNFVGCGTPTVGQFYILDNTNGHYTYNIKMINGDGTVPLKSAEALNASSTYYVKNAQHALMPSTSGVKELIAEILTATSTTDFDISTYSNLATNSGNCTIPNGRIVSFHSPIELHIYDSSGNHTGPDANGDIENNITGVTYEVVDDNKFAFLPDGTSYTIKGSATSAGTFDVRIQELVNGEVATTTLFTDAVLTQTSQVQFSINSNTPAQITLDHDNDGTYEYPLNVSTTTAGLLESTGKVAAVVPAANLISDHASSKPEATSTQKQISLEIATSSEPILQPLATTTVNIVPPMRMETSKPVEKSIIPTSTQESSTENTAIVYKSFGYKLKGAFKSLWSWIRSKL